MKRTEPHYYHVEVAPSPERTGQMQRIVAAHLRYWGLQELVMSATRGIGLLLAAVASGPVERVGIETWWTGQHLITAVSHPALAGVGRDEAAHAHLRQIATLSDGWGGCTTNVQHITWFSLRKTDDALEPLAVKQPEPCSSEALSPPQSPALHGSGAAREPEIGSGAVREPEPAAAGTAS
jgi:hypothetical protein